MDNAEYDRLRQAYKDAVEQWVAAIREEEALATPNHSMIAMEHWDTAGFKEQDTEGSYFRQRGLQRRAALV